MKNLKPILISVFITLALLEVGTRFILTESNGMATGSARSVKDFDVYTAIENCSHLLEQFGGHKYAAGLTLKEENYEAFKQAFDA